MPPSLLTPEKLTAFCAALAETGIVRKACAAVGISRQCAYTWREDYPAFAEAWDKALKIGVTALEDEAHRRAFEGSDKPLTHQGQFTYLYEEERDADGNVVINELTGQPRMRPARNADGSPKVATMKEYSDTLAIFLLKAHAPEKYRENSRVDLTSSDGSMSPVDEGTRNARIAAILAKGQQRKDAAAEQAAEPSQADIDELLDGIA